MGSLRIGLIVVTSVAGAALAIACASSAGGEDDGADLPRRTRRSDAGADGSPDDPSTSSSGGTSSGGSSGNPDGAPPAPPTGCDLAKPFGPAARLTELDSVTYVGVPSLTADELELYILVQTATNDWDLAVAKRASRTAAFGLPQKLTTLNTTQPEGLGNVTPDGLSLYFYSFRNPPAGGGLGDLYVATRASRAAGFGAPVFLNGVNTSDSEYMPGYASGGGGEIFYTTYTATALGIFHAKRVGAGWSTPSRLDDIGTGSFDTAASPSDDDLRFVFASSRAGVGGTDMWYATRSSTSQPFSTPVGIPGINTPNEESGGWMSDDGCRLYFMSDRDNPGQNGKLFYASR